MINNSQEFIQRMIELNELYEDVKLIIILSENFDNENKTRISITLELRNALDHILRSISESNDLNKEIQDAKDHIIRAGYDAYEIASISVCNRIIKDISKYDSAIISTVFPDYYHVIKPLIAKIQIELAEIRAGRINVNGNNNLKEYGKKVKVLIEKFEEVQFQIPELECESQRSKDNMERNIRANNIKWIIGLGATLLIGITVQIFRAYVLKK